ncbi:hypothetical protein OsI_23341 [Oryza sativa Indica Group]|uniref:AP2/ERF domain-containing protein n=1 Tax=Oryza sativa subsp. indica TaxID=39946 RepID=B8B3L0_ORYSI|nr:hypothetical protein OsI_23341 [Oryza sativa Indica Group]
MRGNYHPSGSGGGGDGGGGKRWKSDKAAPGPATTRDTFNTAEDAAMAYDRETFKLHSKNVRLNFSDRFLRKGCVVRLTTGDI